MFCINIFGYSESGSDSEEGRESSSGSEEDEDESKSESEASTKTGYNILSIPKLCSTFNMVCIKQHPANLYNACFSHRYIYIVLKGSIKTVKKSSNCNMHSVKLFSERNLYYCPARV